MQEFFYLDSQNEQKGPVGAHELIGCGVTRDTLVWNKDMDSWKPAGTVPELSAVFPPQPPVVPGYSAPTPPPAPAAAPYGGYSAPGVNPVLTEKKPDNLLVWSILCTVLCCLPLGIVAIVQSNRVDKLWAIGDRAGAEQAAKTAKTMIIISAVLGFVGSIGYFVVALAAL